MNQPNKKHEFNPITTTAGGTKMFGATPKRKGQRWICRSEEGVVFGVWGAGTVLSVQFRGTQKKTKETGEETSFQSHSFLGIKKPFLPSKGRIHGGPSL